jgi:hypothetical protein
MRLEPQYSWEPPANRDQSGRTWYVRKLHHSGSCHQSGPSEQVGKSVNYSELENMRITETVVVNKIF